jgi:hypothetical protein
MRSSWSALGKTLSRTALTLNRTAALYRSRFYSLATPGTSWGKRRPEQRKPKDWSTRQTWPIDADTTSRKLCSGAESKLDSAPAIINQRLFVADSENKKSASCYVGRTTAASLKKWARKGWVAGESYQNGRRKRAHSPSSSLSIIEFVNRSLQMDNDDERDYVYHHGQHEVLSRGWYFHFSISIGLKWPQYQQSPLESAILNIVAVLKISNSKYRCSRCSTFHSNVVFVWYRSQFCSLWLDLIQTRTGRL